MQCCVRRRIAKKELKKLKVTTHISYFLLICSFSTVFVQPCASQRGQLLTSPHFSQRRQLTTNFPTLFFQIEARSVGHLKKLQKGMENKIMELQRKLDQSVRFYLVIPKVSIQYLAILVKSWRESVRFNDLLNVFSRKIKLQIF